MATHERVHVERPHPDGRAAELADSLAAQGVRAVATTIVDNAGVARVKAFPVAELERAARRGVGLSPIFNVCLVNDAFTASAEVGGPVGDLRLIPDLSALRVLTAEPGWAWAPADQHTQEGKLFGCCQRSFARRMAGEAAARGIEVRVGSEIEWFAGHERDGTVTPAHRGPAYGFAVLAELSDYARDVVAALADVGIGQLHPEYAAGQLEISLPPGDPVAAGDLNVFARQTIRAVSAQHGLRASFSPVVVPDQVGNGGHLHLSVWRSGRNLLAGDSGPRGMTATGEAFVAGVLTELPALAAVGSPSAASYLRMRPSHWAGAYRCWGRENREAALRFVTGSSANVEVKCFDQSANPYLAIGSVIAAGLEGIDRGLTLPREIDVDPASLSGSELQSRGVERLPRTLDQALSSLESSAAIRPAMGEMLFGAFAAVRKAECDAFAGEPPDAVAAAHRWRY